MGLGRRAEHKLLGRPVVKKIRESPLRLALLPQFTILDKCCKRVLFDVVRLVLAFHRIVEKEQVAAGDAQRG